MEGSKGGFAADGWIMCSGAPWRPYCRLVSLSASITEPHSSSLCSAVTRFSRLPPFSRISAPLHQLSPSSFVVPPSVGDSSCICSLTFKPTGLPSSRPLIFDCIGLRAHPSSAPSLTDLWEASLSLSPQLLCEVSDSFLHHDLLRLQKTLGPCLSDFLGRDFNQQFERRNSPH